MNPGLNLCWKIYRSVRVPWCPIRCALPTGHRESCEVANEKRREINDEADRVFKDWLRA